MAVLSVESKQRATGITVAIGLLIMVFGFAYLLSRPEAGGVLRSNPVWFVGMLIIFAAALALISVVFKWLGLANAAEAFGLPTGSVRALLAVAVMVLFTVFGLAAIVSDDKAPKRPSERLGAAVVATAAADKEIDRYAAMSIAAIRENADADVTRLQLYRLEQARPTETVDLMKQIVTALVTLVTSVISFYFGSRSVEASKDNSGRAPPTSPPASTSEDIKRIDAELEEASQRLVALQGETAPTGNETALVSALSRLADAVAVAKASRVKLEARLKDLASGAATAEAVTAETDALKASLMQVKDLVAQSEALIAKG